MKRVLCLIMMIVTAAAFAGCSGGDGKSYDVQKAGEEITAQIESASQMTKINDDILASFYGIDISDVDSYFVLISTDSTNQDEVVMIEAKDAEASGRVLEKVQTRYDSKYAQTKDYLPDEAKKIEESKVESDGRFVWMFISEDAGKMEEIFASTAE